MQRVECANHADPLDLLRRFIPTPLKAMYRLGAVHVMVETNDFALLPELPLDVNLDGTCDQILEWKLIRDADSPGHLASPVIMESETLTVVVMGTACLLGLDHERHELLGFIGSEIDAQTYQEFLVPFLCRMSKEARSGNASIAATEWNEDSGNV